MGVGGGVAFSGKKRYEGVMFSVISVTRGWVWVQFLENLRYGLEREWVRDDGGGRERERQREEERGGERERSEVERGGGRERER